MGSNNTHDNTPDQFGTCGAIEDLGTANFSLPGGVCFNIDNENEEAIVLSVKFKNSDSFISKKIYPGPNVFLIKEIELNEVLTTELDNLKYGY